jgi:hypothetical protein
MGHWALGIGHWALGIGHARSSHHRIIALLKIRPMRYALCAGALGIGHWALGIGHWARSQLASSHHRIVENQTHALCAMRYALCLMRYALCAMPHALCPIATAVLSARSLRGCRR